MFARWNDFERELAVMDELRRRMDSLMHGYEPSGIPASQTGWPRVNLYDAESAVVLEAEVPGVAREDLEITVSQDTLTLAGKRAAEVPEGYSVHRRERGAVEFSRSFALREKVDPEKVTADLADGVLTITLHKAAEAQPRKITVG